MTRTLLSPNQPLCFARSGSRSSWKLCEGRDSGWLRTKCEAFGRQIRKAVAGEFLICLVLYHTGAVLWLPKYRPPKQRVLGGLRVMRNHWWVLEIIVGA